MARAWTVVVPVKDSSVGKSRLADFGDGRAELARAMALDTLEAVRGAARVGRVVLVTSDPMLAADARGWSTEPAAVVVPDPGRDLRAAIDAGLAEVEPVSPAAVLTADLPALRPDQLDAALAAAHDHRLSVVADSDGVGTTMLAATRAADLAPRFGEASLAAHRQLGAYLIDGPPGLRRDADLPAHLSQLAGALGPRTAEAVRRLAVR